MSGARDGVKGVRGRSGSLGLRAGVGTASLPGTATARKLEAQAAFDLGARASSVARVARDAARAAVVPGMARYFDQGLRGDVFAWDGRHS